jgi:hypothetical protein
LHHAAENFENLQLKQVKSHRAAENFEDLQLKRAKIAPRSGKF